MPLERLQLSHLPIDFLIHVGDPPALPREAVESLTAPGLEVGDETPHPPVSRQSTSPLGEVVDFPSSLASSGPRTHRVQLMIGRSDSFAINGISHWHRLSRS